MSLLLLPLALYGAYSIYRDPSAAIALAAKLWVWLSNMMKQQAKK